MLIVPRVHLTQCAHQWLPRIARLEGIAHDLDIEVSQVKRHVSQRPVLAVLPTPVGPMNLHDELVHSAPEIGVLRANLVELNLSGRDTACHGLVEALSCCIKVAM